MKSASNRAERDRDSRNCWTLIEVPLVANFSFGREQSRVLVSANERINYSSSSRLAQQKPAAPRSTLVPTTGECQRAVPWRREIGPTNQLVARSFVPATAASSVNHFFSKPLDDDGDVSSSLFGSPRHAQPERRDRRLLTTKVNGGLDRALGGSRAVYICFERSNWRPQASFLPKFLSRALKNFQASASASGACNDYLAFAFFSRRSTQFRDPICIRSGGAFRAARTNLRHNCPALIKTVPGSSSARRRQRQ